jgi:hypothetical protein
VDEKPLIGGDTIYLQHQDYPIEKVYNRTDLDPAPEPVAPTPTPPPPPAPDDTDERTIAALIEIRAHTLRMAA